MGHPFIAKRSKVKRLKRLQPIEQTLVKQLGGKGNSYQYTKTGPRADLQDGNIYRSGWEADLARVLTVHRIKFLFEPLRFDFPIKKGTKSYTPDFYLPDTDEYIEIKGWFDDKSRIKLKRWKIYYPKEFQKLHVIISKYNKKAEATCKTLGVPNIMYFEDFKKHYNDIPNWESK